ncbi:hypothetical protein DSM112329_05109 [Paraconexibacter sp. AEG42_29]|uniref:Uncharacterized protein n=1 Tax=Paraconexibacter sp. AEG42_29 TaxID=2997339 RepID=A0AAU7B2W1_9ACTN
MKEWLRTYGWKFALALLVAAAAMWWLVHLERKSAGEASVPSPVVALVAPTPPPAVPVPPSMR